MKIILRLCLLIMISVIYTPPVLAQPPLVGEMTKLETFSPPEVMPELLIDSTDEVRYFLSDFSNRIVLVNLWATWCPPCIEELSSLDALEEARGGDNFKVVAISIDDDMTAEDIAEFYKKQGIEHLEPMIDHESSTSELPNLAGLPTSYIFNQSNNMVARYQGETDWNSPEALTVIDHYIQAMKDENAF